MIKSEYWKQTQSTFLFMSQYHYSKQETLLYSPGSPKDSFSCIVSQPAEEI
jgi:hypothetical protein